MTEPWFALLSPRANAIVEEIDIWWRRSRVSAPTLFADELCAALERLSIDPQIGIVCSGPGRREMRRLLLRQTGYQVCYSVRPRLRRVDVVAVWHAAQGHGPFSKKPG